MMTMVVVVVVLVAAVAGANRMIVYETNVEMKRPTELSVQAQHTTTTKHPHHTQSIKCRLHIELEAHCTIYTSIKQKNKLRLDSATRLSAERKIEYLDEPNLIYKNMFVVSQFSGMIYHFPYTIRFECVLLVTPAFVRSYSDAIFPFCYIFTIALCVCLLPKCFVCFYGFWYYILRWFFLRR